jgi:4-amino-4-deoxy-L-arabinose transferase-like glycosyltransferase
MSPQGAAATLCSVSFSWQTRSASAHPRPAGASAPPAPWAARTADWARAAATRLPRPELSALIALAGALNLWALARNGWANDYYSAAVRSMSSSWHDFLFASLDHSGVMTVDKPPLALWVQALSVRVFGYHPLSVLVPQALMGVASVALVYDLVRRRFGRLGGFVGGLALALTPITVAVSRHNNPDALLVLCCVAALWCAVRALEHGSGRWLALAGVCVGLGFETKMGVALVVLPGIAAAWLWVAPAARGRLHALWQLIVAGGAMVLVGGAWSALVELTPAADRPWVSGTGDNRVLSLILEYNGVGRVDGQAGGPGGIGGSMFGGTPGPLRLLNSALGGQAGWLLGFALISAAAILVASRLRRADPRSGWLIVVGGALAVTAVLFSEASGIFHPYYVSLLAPFIAALVGAGAAEMIGDRRVGLIAGPLAILAGVGCELAVLGDYPGELTWLPAVLIAFGVAAIAVLVTVRSRRGRAAAISLAVGVLLIAPSVWAIDTLGHATSGTFPSGGPASVLNAGGPPGGTGGRRFGAVGQGGGQPLFGPPGGTPPGAGGHAGREAGGTSATAGPGASPIGPPPGLAGARQSGAGALGGGLGAGPGGPFGNTRSLAAVARYAAQHGGGTVAVASQSSAASAIIAGDVQFAGIGGFSGRESDVSVRWLAQEVRSGEIRWVLDQPGAGGPGGFGRDTRQGSTKAMKAVAQVCQKVTLPSETASAGTGASASNTTEGAGSGSLYDCKEHAASLMTLATRA